MMVLWSLLMYKLCQRFNSYNAEIFLYKPRRSTVFLNLKSSQMSQLPRFVSFQYLCSGSTAIIHFSLILWIFSLGIVYKSQILTSEDASEDVRL